MFLFRIDVVGYIVEMSANFESTKRFCQDYLTDMQADDSVAITPEDIAFERAKSLREDEIEGIPPRDFTDAYLETIALQRKLVEKLFAHDTLLFHGSVVAVDGQAYLFTAKSGTGKSTHTRLWREVFGERAVMVNDDKPFLKITDRGVTVYGSPWNGKHRLGENISAPLKAICILERGEENSIRPVTPQEVLPLLIQQSQRPQNSGNLPKYLELMDKLAGNVNFYRMSCNMEPQAAAVAYDAMSR